MAYGLAAVAGFVDAAGFLITGGFFVSFMSGNSTRMGVGLVESAASAGLALSLIVAFVVGVSAGALVGRKAGTRRPPAVLALVALSLAGAAALASVSFAIPATLVLAFAMGAENTVFAQDGEVRIGLTYMTGALVKLGKGVTTALLGGDRFGWAPYLLLWMGLVLGAAFGALAFSLLGSGALWIAAGLMTVLSALSTGLRLDDPASAAA